MEMDADPINWDHRRRANRPFHGLYRKSLRCHGGIVSSTSSTRTKKLGKSIPTAFYLQQVYLSRDPTCSDPYESIDTESFECSSLLQNLLLTFYVLLGRVGQLATIVVFFTQWLLCRPLILICKIVAGIEWELFAVFALSVWLWSRADASGGMTRKEAARAVSELWRTEHSLYSFLQEVKELGKFSACKRPGNTLTNDSRRLLDPNCWGIRDASGRWLTYEQVLRHSVPGRPARTK
ncbi:hypothetical protein B7463_g2759, partial [Scytalidium lignicola]